MPSAGTFLSSEASSGLYAFLGGLMIECGQILPPRVAILQFMQRIVNSPVGHPRLRMSCIIASEPPTRLRCALPPPPMCSIVRNCGATS